MLSSAEFRLKCKKKRHDRSSQIEMSAITLIPQNRRKGKRRRLRQKHGAAECFHQTLDPFCPSLVHPPPPNFSFATVFSFTLHRGVLRRFHVLPLNQALTSPLSLSLSLPPLILSLSLSFSLFRFLSLSLSRFQRDEAGAGGGRQQMLHPLQAAPLQRALLHPLLRALHLPAQPQAPVPGLPVQRLQDLLHLQQEGQSVALLSVPEGQVSVSTQTRSHTHPGQRQRQGRLGQWNE